MSDEHADAEAMVARLADCAGGVLLVGVRHHSPAVSASVEAMLAAFGPTRVCVELPSDYAPWIPHLTDPELSAPVALAGARSDGGALSFYPFADFSPELVAMRWARREGVPIEAIDLELGAGEELREEAPKESGEASWLEALHAHFEVPAGENLWDHVVEARAPGATHEQVRRAGLLVGWALRLRAHQRGGVAPRDLARERFMHARVAAHTRQSARVAVVVGAFHAPALLDPPALFDEAAAPITTPSASFVTSLIPYAFELLDARSGYPAGIRDPGFQERAYRAMRDASPLEDEVAAAIVAIARELRAVGQVAGVPDAKEALRMAGDLARLRGLPSPGRRELLEGVQSCFGHGETLGGQRVLARACERVLVGRRRGSLAPGTPRSGLFPHVQRLLEELRLPGPAKVSREPLRLRLDPLRSPLDRQRHIALTRLGACAVPYAALVDGEAAGSVETLTQLWELRWVPATEAMVELAGLRGVTLAQAAEGSLRERARGLEAEGKRTATATLAAVEAAAECGLASLTSEGLRALVGGFALEADLPELVAAIALIERLRRGHVPALPVDAALVCPGVELFRVPPGVEVSVLVAAAVRALEGLEGSERVEDARAALALVRLFEGEGGEELGDGRLGWSIDRLANHGAPLISGAAAGLRVLLGRGSAQELGVAASGWVDAAVDAASRRALAGRLRGLFAVAGPLLEAHGAFLDALAERIEGIDDDAFLARVAALRDGFDGMSPASRDRLLAAISDRLGARDRAGRPIDVRLDHDPVELARYARADRAGREEAARWPSS